MDFACAETPGLFIVDGGSLENVTVRNISVGAGIITPICIRYGNRSARVGEGASWMKDILIENVFTSKVLAPEEIGTHSRAHYPLIWVEGPVDVGNLTVRNFVRDEHMLPVATIRIDKPATVRHLTVRDWRMVNRLDEPLTFIDRRGKVEKLTLENNDFTAAPGEWTGR